MGLCSSESQGLGKNVLLKGKKGNLDPWNHFEGLECFTSWVKDAFLHCKNEFQVVNFKLK